MLRLQKQLRKVGLGLPCARNSRRLTQYAQTINRPIIELQKWASAKAIMILLEVVVVIAQMWLDEISLKIRMRGTMRLLSNKSTTTMGLCYLRSCNNSTIHLTGFPINWRCIIISMGRGHPNTQKLLSKRRTTTRSRRCRNSLCATSTGTCLNKSIKRRAKAHRSKEWELRQRLRCETNSTES